MLAVLLVVHQVRQLREELLSARRDRAVGEAREAELRRELSSLKRQVTHSCFICVTDLSSSMHGAPLG